MLLAHKIALDPNAAQRMYFARAAGTRGPADEILKAILGEEE